MAEVLVKIVIELLSILSIATKEVKKPRASMSDVSEKYASRVANLMFPQNYFLGICLR